MLRLTDQKQNPNINNKKRIMELEDINNVMYSVNTNGAWSWTHSEIEKSCLPVSHCKNLTASLADLKIKKSLNCNTYKMIQ